MKQCNIIEGNSGVLELVGADGIIEIYRPDCDLDKAKDLLYKFYQSKTSNASIIKESYYINELNWFPTSIGMLYWHYFYQIVKYKPIIDKVISGEIEVLECSPGRFKKIMELVHWYPQHSLIQKLIKRIYHFIIQTRNFIITKKSGDILLFQYKPEDFRTSQIYDALKTKFSVVKLCNVPLKDIWRYFFDTSVYIYVEPYANSYSNIELADDSDFVFNGAIKYTSWIINKNLTSYHSHARLFKHMDYSLLIGLDDTTIVYPLLYALSDKSIHSLGIQHGAYVSRHEDYIMNGGIKDYKWFDNVIVWGDYWKRLILKHSNLFDDSYHIVASNKHSYNYKLTDTLNERKVVLIPHEFLADTIAVGEYIRKFIDQGFDVHFKVRPGTNDEIDDQLHAYFLGDYHEKITIIEEITSDQMSCVGVIAGTSTTLLFDLLPFQKPIFLLDTPLKFIMDMADDGFARLISMSDMESINDIYNKEVKDSHNDDFSDIFGSEPIDNVIFNYIQSIEGPK